MSKQIQLGFQAQQSIKNGVDIAANAAKITLGPTGRGVILGKKWGGPTISDDGVTVLKEIELKDNIENAGVQLMQEVATKTNDNAGDGTTTATVLAQKMIEEGFAALQRDPFRANDLKRGMDKAVKFVVEELGKAKKEVKGKEGVQQVATISSLDAEVGKLIAEAMDEVGQNGVITVEEGQSIGLEKEVVLGMRFDKGYVSGYMVTDTARMEAVWDDAAILITDKKVSSVQEVLPILEKVAQSGKKELVIIADDIDGEALTTFVVNKIRGTFNVLGIKAPGFGDRRKEMLADIAVLTGGQVISDELGLKFDKVELEHLGRARKVIASKENTTIVGGQGSQDAINARVAQIDAAIKESTSDFDKEKLQERKARLSGGVGVIKVGAYTETEMKAKKFKIEDALNATKAAVEEGIVAGGGAALARVAPRLEDEVSGGKYFQENEKIGAMIVRRALEAPIRQIAENSGIEATGIVKFVQNAKSDYAGYDFLSYSQTDWTSGQREDMIEAGIVDPVKVTRLALENAVSVASTLITTGAVIVDEPEKEKAAPEATGMGGMGGMGY